MQFFYKVKNFFLLIEVFEEIKNNFRKKYYADDWKKEIKRRAFNRKLSSYEIKKLFFSYIN